MARHPASPDFHIHGFLPQPNFKGGGLLSTVLTVAAIGAAAFSAGSSLGLFGADAAAAGGEAAAGAEGAAIGGGAAAGGGATLDSIVGAGVGGADSEAAAAGTDLAAGSIGSTAGGSASLGATVLKYLPAATAAAQLGSAGASIAGAVNGQQKLPTAQVQPGTPTINQAEEDVQNEVAGNSSKGALANLLQPAGQQFLSGTNTSLRQMLGG